MDASGFSFLICTFLMNIYTLGLRAPLPLVTQSKIDEVFVDLSFNLQSVMCFFVLFLFVLVL